MSIGTQPEEKKCKGIGWYKHLNNSTPKFKGILIFISVYQIQIRWSNMDKLYRSLTVNHSRFGLPRTNSRPEWRQSRKNEFTGINWRLRASAHIESLGSKRQWQGSSTKTTRHKELSIVQAGEKNLQGSRLPRISTTSESIPRYLANTRVSGKGGRDSKDG